MLVLLLAADDMYKHGILEGMRKKSYKYNNYLQALGEVRGGWAKKEKSYKGYLRRLYTHRERT